jgi:hypothetical protein
VLYDVLRSTTANDFSSPTCLLTNTLATDTEDDDEPGAIVHYLVRSKNACGANVGQASDGTPRSAGVCPGSEFPATTFRGPWKIPGAHQSGPTRRVLGD